MPDLDVWKLAECYRAADSAAQDEDEFAQGYWIGYAVCLIDQNAMSDEQVLEAKRLSEQRQAA